jgi:hypothetical protein
MSIKCHPKVYKMTGIMNFTWPCLTHPGRC